MDDAHGLRREQVCRIAAGGSEPKDDGKPKLPLVIKTLRTQLNA